MRHTQYMGLFRRLFGTELHPASTKQEVETLNLSEVLKVLVVDKLKAEAEIERAKLEALKEEHEFRKSNRERQREAGRNRSRTAKRDSRGRLLPKSGTGNPVACRLCQNPKPWNFTQAELDEHRTHSGGSAEQQPKPEQLN